MLRRVWDWLALSPSGERDPAREARTLRAVVWSLLGAALLGLALAPLLLDHPVSRAALAAATVPLLFSAWLVRRGRLALARSLVMLTVLGAVTILLSVSDRGIQSVTAMILPAVIVVGALILSQRGFALATLLTVVVAVGLVVADVRRGGQALGREAAYHDVFAPAIYLLFTALLVRALAADLTRSLARERRNARDLLDASLRMAQQSEALERSEARWGAYLEQATDLVFVLDADGRFVSANQATCTTLGYPLESLLGRSALDLAEPEDRPAVAEAFEAIVAGGRVYQLETRARTGDGRTVVLELRGRTLREHEVVTGTFHIARDITERRRLEEQRAREQVQREHEERERRALESRLQQAHKLESLGRLTGGIAHDFNNLLMAILGNIDLALDVLPGDSPAREPLLAAGRASGRATELTRQMLASAGRGKTSIETLDLGRLITGTAGILRASVSKKVDLRLDLREGLPPIRGDASQIRQVVMNVVINASEALGDRPGAITVSTSSGFRRRAELADSPFGEDLPEGDYVALEIRDSGPGMDQKTIARVFDPFFSTKFTGRGLGLAVVLGIARGHRAAVRIESVPGQGTAFRVLFPVAASGGAPAGLGAVVNPSGSGTVLLVDDDELVRRPARAMLERLGYEVIEADDGRGAIELFKANCEAIRCVLLDLSMPRMDGEEAFRALRAVDPAVRVVISSGYGEQDTAPRFGDAPPAAFIQKPYTLQRLGEVLQRVLQA